MTELITDVRIFPINHDKLKANVSFTIMESFAIKAKIVETKNGLMVQMPSQSYQKDGATQYQDLAFPITKEARQEMIEKVITKYKSEVDGTSSESSDESSKPSGKKGSKVPF